MRYQLPLRFSDLRERILHAGVVIERGGAPAGHEVIRPQPIDPDDDRIYRERSNVLDEARQMPLDLWIRRLIVDSCRGNRPRLTKLVDLHHPRRDRTSGRLPDHTAKQPQRQKQIAECNQPPVLRLNTGRTDAFVPYLRRALVWSVGLRLAPPP